MYREVKPSLALSQYVTCFWLLEKDYSGPDARETVWPDGKVELLFHFGHRYCLTSGHSSSTMSPSFVIGPTTKYLTLQSSGKVRLVGIRFFPWGFYPFFPTSLNHLRDRVVPFSELVGSVANELEERLTTTNADESFAVLEQHLLRRLAASAVVIPAVILNLARSIVEKPGAIESRDIELATGLSLRQVERRFRRSLG